LSPTGKKVVGVFVRFRAPLQLCDLSNQSNFDRMEQLRAMNLQSKCVYEDQVEDQTAVATTNLNAVLSEHIVLNAGASLKVTIA
jgi:hypothetical protein